jgi:hypothetical protein
MTQHHLFLMKTLNRNEPFNFKDLFLRDTNLLSCYISTYSGTCPITRFSTQKMSINFFLIIKLNTILVSLIFQLILSFNLDLKLLSIISRHEIIKNMTSD